MDGFIGEIRMFSYDVVPWGWLPCNGQLVLISQYPNLFGVIGTTYGGDGIAAFALPDLRGRAPMQPGAGFGLSSRTLGESGGSEWVTLLEAHMPVHSHPMQADTVNPADANMITSSTSLAISTGGQLYQNAADGSLASNALQSAGANEGHYNVQPYVAFLFCIATYGMSPF